MSQRLRVLVALFALVSLVAASCADDDDPPSDDLAEEELPAETEAPADTEAAVEEDDPLEEESSTVSVASVSGVEVAGVKFDTGKAVIINFSDSPIDLAGLWICNRPGYAELPPIELDPMGGIEVDLPGGADADGGEAAIYVSNDFGDSGSIVSYVHWGSGGGRASVAEAAGIWSGPTVDPGPNGLSLIDDAGSAAGWE